MTQSYFCYCLALVTTLTKAGEVILLTHSPIFCPCVTDPFKKEKKCLVAPLTINKHSQLRRNLAANPSEQHSNVVGLLFLFFFFNKEMKNNLFS